MQTGCFNPATPHKSHVNKVMAIRHCSEAAAMDSYGAYLCIINDLPDRRYTEGFYATL